MYETLNKTGSILKNVNQNLNFKKYKVDVESLDNPFTGKLKENIITYSLIV